MPGLINTGLTGQLTVSGVVLNGPTWDLPDLRAIWMSAATRGTDRLIPGVEGLRAKRRRRTGTLHSLPMYISGEVDPDGDPYDICDTPAEFMANLATNIDYLMINVVNQPLVPVDGTRAVSLTTPSGDTRTSDIHVLNLTAGNMRDDGLAMLAVLDISIPRPSELIAT